MPTRQPRITTEDTVFDVMLHLPRTTRDTARAVIEPVRKSGEAWINVWESTRAGTTLRLISRTATDADARDDAEDVLDIIRRMGVAGTVSSVRAISEDEIE